MDWSGLIFILIGLGVVLGSSKVAEHNRSIRRQESAKAKEHLKHAQGTNFLAKMRVNFYKSSLEAGKVDRFSIALTGIATIILGVFFLFHPNGW